MPKDQPTAKQNPKRPPRTRRTPWWDHGNQRVEAVSLRQVVSDPQFRSGYRDRVAGLPPRKLYYDTDLAGADDTFGYERGRLVATWLLAAGHPLPKSSDVARLVRAYGEARAQDVVL
jgi:hypothetical protein